MHRQQNIKTTEQTTLRHIPEDCNLKTHGLL